MYACHGVTNIENPQPIDQDTLFLVASITKVYTATTLMRMVAEGKVDLNAPVRRYVPEFRLKDRQAADTITVLHLLNHTAGLDWRVNADTGEGDDALARLVAKMAEMELIAPPRHPNLLQSGGLRPARADHRESHGPDLRASCGCARLRAAGALAQFLRAR
jgi:CubicO group peptidase (beta-lactamase class C family)